MHRRKHWLIRQLGKECGRLTRNERCPINIFIQHIIVVKVTALNTEQDVFRLALPTLGSAR